MPGAFKIDYEQALNAQQYEAVKEFAGPILCIAGAGSGKTRTLIYRVAHMIESGINPENILLLTFTRRAARNMLERVVDLIGSEGKFISGGTYHSFASAMLRKYGHFIGIPCEFSILDESDSAEIINLIRSELVFNKKDTRFPQKKTIAQMFAKAQDLGKPIPEIISNFYAQFAEHSDDLIRLHCDFSAYKQKNFLLDYDDLLHDLHRLLRDSNEARLRIVEKFRYIMADEYQDTNAVQARITILLGGQSNNVMVVGDDAQSIYSFRGARVSNIVEFPKSFAQCRIVKLERNYRSSAAILDAANSLMESASECFKKKLYTERNKGHLPARIQCEDEQEQAMFVASRILDLRQQGVKFNEMAVLFRASFHAYQLELELKRRKIPYVKFGGAKFLEAGHLKDMIAHLRILQNPYDQVSWLRVLPLIDGIGSQTATEVFNYIKTIPEPFDLSGFKGKQRIVDGLRLLSQMLLLGTRNIQSHPARLLEIVTDYFFPILKARYDDYQRRFKDIDQLAVIADKFAGLPDFLADLALEPPADLVEEALVLSTIHSAKGLEWHSVFVISALEGRFPTFGSLKSAADIEEERRLLYVAMTRAEENLAISYPSQVWDPSTSTFLDRPSRFLGEVKSNLLEFWQIKR